MVRAPKIIKNAYKKYGYFFNSAFLVFVNALANVFNYISSIYINRNLSIEDFAQYNAIINIYTIIILTISSYGYYIMQNYHKNKEKFFKDSFYWTYGYIFSFVITFFYIICVPLMHILFNISDYKAMYLSAVMLYFGILIIVSQSILRMNGFITYEYTANLISVFIMKILFLAYFIITGFNLSKAIITVTSATLVYFLIQILCLKKLKFSYYSNIKDMKEYFSLDILKSIFISIIPILIVNFIFNVAAGYDMLMAKRYLNAENAGYYATMSIIVKIFLYIGSAIAAVMYSYLTITKAQKNKKKENMVILSSVTLLLIASVFLALFLIAFSKQFILIQFTQRYDILIPLMPKAVIFGFSLSFSVIVFNYCLVYKFYKPFYAYILFFFFVYIALRNYERTFDRFISIFLVFFISLFIYNALIFILHRIWINKKENSI